MAPVIKLTLAGVVENLSVGFARRQILQGVNCQLHSGLLSVVIGRSGCGKSTFLRAFNRLNEHFPACQSSGSVQVRFQDGWQDIYRDEVNPTDLKRRVGLVFQNPNIFPTMSVEKNITLPLQVVSGLAKTTVAARMESSLRQVHLWNEVKDRLSVPVATLSGGQQQRLCLARVLALEPELLLLDEPTANLDFLISQKIEELLLDLKTKYQIIVVSHSLSQARRLADQLLILKDGSLISTLSPAEFNHPEIWQGLLEEIF
jgi:phosphate transport system ATP-binding protein